MALKTSQHQQGGKASGSDWRSGATLKLGDERSLPGFGLGVESWVKRGKVERQEWMTATHGSPRAELAQAVPTAEPPVGRTDLWSARGALRMAGGLDHVAVGRQWGGLDFLLENWRISQVFEPESTRLVDKGSS